MSQGSSYFMFHFLYTTSLFGSSCLATKSLIQGYQVEVRVPARWGNGKDTSKYLVHET